MSIGSQILQARQAAGLSQRELAGTTITRNMLSLLEHDQAKPSLDTLQELAKRLGKPVSFFLGEDCPRVEGLDELRLARQAYRERAYARCLDHLEEIPEGELLEPERRMLRLQAALELAAEALEEGKDRYCRTLLERCGPWLEQCPYAKEAFAARRAVLLARSARTDAELREAEPLLPDVEEVLMLRAAAALPFGAPEQAVRLLEAVSNRDGRWQILRGDAAFAAEDYAAAVECYTRAEGEYPREVRKGLQLSYAKLGNFEKAYAYATMEDPAPSAATEPKKGTIL